jgi:hypothetical protein
MSRQYTQEEIRDKFMTHVAALVRYWQRQVDCSSDEKVEGITHSLLVALDGGAMALPAFKVIADPHPADKQYHIEHDENWYPESHELNHPGDITADGLLHEVLFKYLKDDE